MTAFINHHQLSALNVFDERLADSEGRQTIFFAPDRERRSLDRFGLAIQEIFAAQDLFDERIDRVAVTAFELVGQRILNKLVVQ